VLVLKQFGASEKEKHRTAMGRLSDHQAIQPSDYMRIGKVYRYTEAKDKNRSGGTIVSSGRRGRVIVQWDLDNSQEDMSTHDLWTDLTDNDVLSFLQQSGNTFLPIPYSILFYS